RRLRRALGHPRPAVPSVLGPQPRCRTQALPQHGIHPQLPPPLRAPPGRCRAVRRGSLPIHATLRYTDDALRQFFATARTMNWYANTIFVITADHTADLERTGRHGDKPIDHWIPLVVHAPGRLAPDRIEDVVQQIDILPLVLQLAGHEAPFFSFGHSP